MPKFRLHPRYSSMGLHYRGKDYIEVTYYWLWFKLRVKFPIRRYDA